MGKQDRHLLASPLDRDALGGHDLGFQKVFGRVSNQNAARYVTFLVGNEGYGLSIRVIEQILKLTDLPTTDVPRTPDFLVGIGNVKGNVIPVIDLAARIGLDQSALDRNARVLVVRHEGELHGIVVSKVLGVCPIPSDTLENAPRAIGRARGDFIEALGTYKEQKIILLNMSALLDPRAFLLPRFRCLGKEIANS